MTGQSPTPPPSLDDKGKSLWVSLATVLNKFDPELSADADEVTINVKPEDVPAICAISKEDPLLNFNYLRCISVVDYVGEAGGRLPPVLSG